MKASVPEFITVGRIIGTVGVRGKLKVKAETDFPGRFSPGARVYIDRQPVTIDAADWHRGNLVLKISSVDSIEDAQRLRGKLLEIHHSQLQPLPEGQYYHFQLIGLEVHTTGGEHLGKVTDILTAAGNDNYVVHGAKGEILIPAIEDVVKSVDLDKGRITIEPLEGLLSLNRKQ